MRKVICKHWHLRLYWPKHDQTSVIAKFKYGIIPKEKNTSKKEITVPLLYHIALYTQTVMILMRFCCEIDLGSHC